MLDLYDSTFAKYRDKHFWHSQVLIEAPKCSILWANAPGRVPWGSVHSRAKKLLVYAPFEKISKEARKQRFRFLNSISSGLWNEICKEWNTSKLIWRFDAWCMFYYRRFNPAAKVHDPKMQSKEICRNCYDAYYCDGQRPYYSWSV